MIIERTIRLTVTDLPDLQSAWVMVMAHVDEFVRPRIEINPITSLEVNGDEWVESYTVQISGAQADTML